MEHIEHNKNEIFIDNEIQWLKSIIVQRMNIFLHKDSGKAFSLYTPQFVTGNEGSYAAFIKEHSLTDADRVALALAFVPYIRPQIFDAFGLNNNTTGHRFSEFGGKIKNGFEGIIPTLSTLLFILAGNDTPLYIYYYKYFEQHFLFREKHLLLINEGNNNIGTTSEIYPSEYLLSQLIKEREYQPEYSSDFPARRLTTKREWNELILSHSTMEQIEEIRLWVEYGQKILTEWNLENKLKHGYRAIFYGPSGTGKTFTASLIGKYTGKEVYCIDLSMISSKYIGETEKNLARIFDIAENKNWILFFDEGDSLFGKRTQVKESHDRYANQEVSYLLQRIEDFSGLIILSTNFKVNIDEAFSRRFQSIIKFKLPTPEEREKLWRNTFSDKMMFEKGLILKDISQTYEITGGGILNVVQYCALRAMHRQTNIVTKEDIINGIRKEYQKTGKII